jgi:APA family basic amino acid/polyamine antiporter
VQNVLTSFKVVLIVGFIVAGFAVDTGNVSHFLERPSLSVIFSDTFAVSLIFIAFAYSGWNAAAYLGSEIKNPRKNIPAALITGTLIVMGLYVLLNVVYVYALSVEEMSGVVEVGAKAALSLFGPGISPYVAGGIAIGLLSVISAMIMAGPRVYYAMALDKAFFRSFAKLTGKNETPAYAIFFQAAIAMIMVVTASFDKLLFYIGFTLSLFAVLTVAGLILLRIRRPSLQRPYKTWGYPVIPLVFIVGNLWIIYFSITNKWITSLFGLGTIAVGSLVYLIFHRRSA